MKSSETSRVGALAMEFMKELEEDMPDGATIVGICLVAEVNYECGNCDEVHTITPTATDIQSPIHEEALFHAGAECAGVDWQLAATDEG